MQTLNRQEVFDTVKDHLLKQGSAAINISVDGTAACVYRASDGKKCAIGALIKDEHYSPMFEGKVFGQYDPANIAGHRLVEAVRRSLDVYLPHEDINFLCRLQKVHDCNFDSWEKVPDDLTAFAKDNQLNP